MEYIFAEYVLDTERRELRRGPDLLAIEPQVFDLLQYLVENRERIVSKDDLIASVWNGRIVSESTVSSRITVARHAIGDSGEDQRFIRTISRKGLRFVGAVHRMEKGEPSATTWKADKPPIPEAGRSASVHKPSIAVLPFINRSGNPEQDYFADGITEDLITALSQFRWFLVIAHGSTATYKGRVADPKQVSRELGVRYVVEGSVRKSATRLRITGQLTDALTGVNLWAGRFDGEFEDVFTLQDDVTASVVGAIAPKLEQAEIERARRKPTDSLDAYDLYLRGVANTVPYTKEGYAEALGLFRRAIKLDPSFAAAYGMGAWCRVTQKVNGWMSDPAAETADGVGFARNAVRLANEDAVALCWGGFSLGYLAHEIKDAIAYVDRALLLNPNYAAALYLSGWLRVFAGDPDGAVERLTQAIQLSPLDPLIFRAYAGLSHAHFFAGRNDEASAFAEMALRERPDWLSAVRIGAACYAAAGRHDEARKLIARMRELDPTFRISSLPGLPPLLRSEDVARWTGALRAAGLSE